MKFAVVNYKLVQSMNKPYNDTLVMVELSVLFPCPKREGNLYTCSKNPARKSRTVWVPAKHLTLFLFRAPHALGDANKLHLVTVDRNQM